MAEMTPERSLTFGRGPGCDVVVSATDEYMSPVHCEVFQFNGRWYVKDCGSTNSTWIRRGGQDIKVGLWSPAHVLVPGDKVRIGRTTLPWEVPA